MKPPTRLLEDPSSSTPLRIDLTRASDAVDPYDVARGLAQLEATLDSAAELETNNDPSTEVSSAMRATTREGAGLGIGATLRGAFTTLETFKVGIVLLAGVSAVGLLATQVERSIPSARAPIQAVKRSGELAANDPAPSPQVAPTASSEPPSADEAAEASGPAEVDSAARREIVQLLRIKQLLLRDPAAAYRLAKASQRDFPEGSLREEREGLGLLALWQLGTSELAARQTREFLERYPHSPLRERLQRLVAASSPGR